MNPTIKRCCTCREYKDLDAFCNNRSRADGKNNTCRPCRKVMKKRNYKKYPRLNEKGLRVVGMTEADYMLVWNRQEGKCAICCQPEIGVNQYGVKRLAVDHCHRTGQFRGLLCTRCNTKLGIVEDVTFLHAAHQYLSR